MTEDEVGRVVERTLSAFFADKERNCRCSLDMKLHQQHHDFIASWVLFVDEMKKIRWAIVKALLIATAFFVVAVFGWGALFRLAHVLSKVGGGQ